MRKSKTRNIAQTNLLAIFPGLRHCVSWLGVINYVADFSGRLNYSDNRTFRMAKYFTS